MNGRQSLVSGVVALVCAGVLVLFTNIEVQVIRWLNCGPLATESEQSLDDLPLIPQPSERDRIGQEPMRIETWRTAIVRGHPLTQLFMDLLDVRRRPAAHFEQHTDGRPATLGEHLTDRRFSPAQSGAWLGGGDESVGLPSDPRRGHRQPPAHWDSI